MENDKLKHAIENGVLHDRYSTIQRYSLLIDSVTSQLAFYAFNRSAAFFQKNPCHSVSMYFSHSQYDRWPKTSVRPMQDFIRERGVGIATSVKTLEVMRDNPSLKHRLFYAYDLADLQLLKTTRDPRTLFAGVRTITRNKEYAKMLSDNLGLICSDGVFMMEIDFEKIKEIYG